MADIHLHDLRHTGDALAAETENASRTGGEQPDPSGLHRPQAREERWRSIAAGSRPGLHRAGTRRVRTIRKRAKDRPHGTVREGSTGFKSGERVTGVEPA
ncbi:hypothetical protein GCM10027184_22260 [Saccharothrix stipae]